MMGSVLVLDSYSFIIGRFMVHGVVLGRMVLSIILRLILISLRRVWSLTFDGLCFIFKQVFVSYFYDAVIDMVLGA